MAFQEAKQIALEQLKATQELVRKQQFDKLIDTPFAAASTLAEALARPANKIIDDKITELQKHISDKKTIATVSSWDDFNKRIDFPAMIQDYGWTPVKQRGKNILFKRPGISDSSHSASFHIDKRIFYVFSTSTEFESEKGYSPFMVYAALAHNKDYSAAGKAVYNLGFGERRETAKKPEPTKINKDNDDFSFILTDQQMESDMERYRTNTFEKGLTTGSADLDRHFLFKRKQLNMVLAFDNVGKTTATLYLSLLAAIFHNWNWLIYTSENEGAECKKILMQFYIGLPLHEVKPEIYKKAKEFVEEHFTFIKTDITYSYVDLLIIVEKVKTKKRIDGFIIDPYNSLERSEKMNGHDFDYKVISEFKAATQRIDLAIYLLYHTTSGAARLKDNGASVAPEKSDGEGGQKFANKADDFLVFHRDTQDEQNYFKMQFHVRKIKKTATGGRVTKRGEPILLSMGANQCFYLDGNGINPVKEWHLTNKTGIAESIQEAIRELKAAETTIKAPSKIAPNINFHEPKESEYAVDESNVPEFLKEENEPLF